MKTYRRACRSYKHPRIRFRTDYDPSGKRTNDFMKAGFLFVILGLLAIILPILTVPHHTKRSGLLWQPMLGTRVENSRSRTISSLPTAGALLVGSILLGLGARLKR